VGNFFSALVSSYADSTLAREKLQRDQQDADRKARVNVLSAALASPNFNWNDPKNVDAVLGQLGELTGGKGKGGKGGAGGKQTGIDHIRSIFDKLKGKVPQQQGLQQPLAVNQQSFSSSQQMAEEKGKADAAMTQAKAQSIIKMVTDTDPGYWKRNPAEYQQMVQSAYGLKTQPAPKWTQVKTEPISGAAIGKPTGTWWAEMHDEQGNVQYVPSAPPKAKSVTIRNGVLTDENGKSWAIDDPNLPPDLKAMADSYTKAKPYRTADELHKEHPDWSPEKIEAEMQKAAFPRIMPVNDAQGNVTGYNYFQGMPGGAISARYVPSPAGAIPPKPTATTLTMQQMATTVLPEAQRVTSEIDSVSKELGPLAGRWNEVMVGKVGVDKPAVAKLQMDLTLLASAVTRTHFGARGGQEYIAAMEKYFRLAQSPEDLKARIASADDWLTTYSKMAGQKPKSVAAATATKDVKTKAAGGNGGGGNKAPRVGEVRRINGQLAHWDGHGWLAGAK